MGGVRRVHSGLPGTSATASGGQWAATRAGAKQRGRSPFQRRAGFGSGGWRTPAEPLSTGLPR
eukprot:4437065-Prymnesium_polylepis.1